MLLWQWKQPNRAEKTVVVIGWPDYRLAVVVEADPMTGPILGAQPEVANREELTVTGFVDERAFVR